MRRKVLSMRISAVIMSAVLSMSSVTVYADTPNKHILEVGGIEVTLPASIDLSSDGNKFTGSGSVSARYLSSGTTNSLVVTVDTSVDYINTEDSSKKVTGSVSFGKSGVEVWSVHDLYVSSSKNISVEVPVPESLGTYEGVINYKINSSQQYDGGYYADEKYFTYNKTGYEIEITGLTDLGWSWVRDSVRYTDSYDSLCIDKYIKDENTLLIPSYFMLEDNLYSISRMSIGAENSNGNMSQIKNVIFLGNTIYSLDDSCFAGCTALTNITIPDEVGGIGDECFKGCTALTNITLPDRMGYLGSHCFADCTALKKIKIPNGIGHIESGTFANCTALTEVYIPDGVRHIELDAFTNCTNITKLHLPATIFDSSYNTFHDCINIQTVYYDDTVDAFLESSLFNTLIMSGSPLLNAHWVFTDYELYLPSYFPDHISTFQIKEEVDLSEYEEMTLDSETILYADRNIDSEVLEKLKGKSKVYIISSEEEDNGIWYEIYTSDEVRGWIFIEDSGVEDSTEDKIDLSQYEEMAIDTATSLYAENDTGSDIVDSLDAGSVVYVISSEETGSGIWYEVYTSDKARGWIFIEDSGVEDSSGEDSTETEEETETEESTEEETETEESTEEETETEESTEDEESSDETAETEEDSDESSETEEDSDESSETEESSDGETDSEENAETEATEDSSSVESTTSEDSESDEIVEEQENLGVETVSEEAEEVVIEEGGESIPDKGDSDIPKVKIEAEVKDEEQE